MAGQHLLRIALIAGMCFLCAAESQGQLKNRPSSTVFDSLQNADISGELNLTAEQTVRIRELSTRVYFRPDQYRPYGIRLEIAKTDQQRKTIYREMAAEAQKHRAVVEGRALAVLTKEQQLRFWQLHYRQLGARSLLSSEIADALRVDEKQQQKLAALFKQRDAAWLKIAPQKQKDAVARIAFRNEWDAKATALLNAGQKKDWKQLIGPVPEFEKKALAEAERKAKSEQKAKEASKQAAAKKTARRASVDFIASFEAQKPAATKDDAAKSENGTARFTLASQTTAKREKRSLSFNFENAPWKIVLEYFAKQTGLTLDAAEVPTDTFNYRDPNTYTPTEALDVINGYLIPKNFILIRRGRFLVVHNLEKPIPPSIVPDVSIEDLPYRGRNELMRVTFAIDDLADVKEAGNEVQGVQSKFGKTVVFATAHRLIVTDIGTNLSRIATLLKNVTVNQDLEALSFQAFPLQHIAASDAEQIVSQQLDASRTQRNVSAGGGSSSDARREFFRQMMERRMGGGSSRGGRSSRGGFGGFGGGSDNSTRATTRTVGDTSVRVTADARTNNLLVLASKAKIKLAEQIVKAIDKPLSEEARRWEQENRSNQPVFRVYKVSRVSSTEVTKTLSALMPEVVINEDGRNGTIHILATPAQHTAVLELIREMDGGGGGGQSLDLIPVKNVDPVKVANTLKAMFTNEGDNAPSIEADVQGKQLLVKGTKTQIAQIQALVIKLDANAQQTPVVSNQTGEFRTYQVPGDPEQFLRMLQQLWGGQNPSNPIRVVPINNPGPIRERITPDGRSLRSPGFQPPVTGRKTGPPSESRRTTTMKRPQSDELFAMVTPEERIKSLRKAGSGRLTSAQPGKTPDGENGKSNGKTNGKQPAGGDEKPIGITIRNGQLVIISKDKAALDRLQKMIEFLSQQIPKGPTWTVFYLQSADCTEAAAMLQQIFPASSVSASSSSANSSLMGSITGGVRSFGNALMDMSGVSSLGNTDALRIIPDVRANALFVSGSYSRVKDVQRVLQVLDATDIPSNARDRLPRMIPVRYADVNEVAGIVRDVFADYMQPTRTNRGNNLNALQMLMGGGNQRGGRNGRSGVQQRQQPVQMTLGVDKRTGQLVVSANDNLFQQVEALVVELDRSAYEGKRTTRVIQLQNANATTITQTLSSMYPNVTITGGTGISSRTNRNQPGRNQPSLQQGGQGNDDATREMQRALFLRQLMQQGGGNNGGRFNGGGNNSSGNNNGGRSFRGFGGDGNNGGSTRFGGSGFGRGGGSSFRGRSGRRGG